MNVAHGVADGVSRRELFRLSAEQKLLDDVDAWMEFHAARNITSHIYDEKKMEMVLERAMLFYPYTQTLLERLDGRQ